LAAIWEDEDIGPEEIEMAASRIGTSGPWFDPHEGLKTVSGLIAHVESLPANEHDARQVTLREGWLTVLRGVASDLEYAINTGTRFQFAFSE